MTPKKAQDIFRKLTKHYPDARIALTYHTPWELLVATILSAQSTDKKINEITAVLFQKYRSIAEYAKADIKEFEQDIYSSGFYRNKAKNIIATARKIIQDFDSKLPHTMEEMLTLPGVARKTANIVLGNAFAIPAGIAVDTHVKRIAQRVGFTAHNNPDKIERDLLKLFPQEDWIAINHIFIAHGRQTCTAKKPNCQICPISKDCDYYQSLKN